MQNISESTNTLKCCAGYLKTAICCQCWSKTKLPLKSYPLQFRLSMCFCLHFSSVKSLHTNIPKNASQWYPKGFKIQQICILAPTVSFHELQMWRFCDVINDVISLLCYKLTHLQFWGDFRVLSVAQDSHNFSAGYPKFINTLDLYHPSTLWVSDDTGSWVMIPGRYSLLPCDNL